MDRDEYEDVFGEIALLPTVLEELFEKKVFVGGPTCTFLGKEIPCLVKISPHGGIDADILVDILRHLDQLELFKHTRQQGRKPFLLVDGHQSRMDLKFINYLRNELHPWKCCFGVPYGTHLWQTADSEQQNGCYKITETKGKEELLALKRLLRFKKNFSITDVIPLIGFAWDRSFAVVETNKDAICERGWFPLNFALLNNPEVMATEVSINEELSNNSSGTLVDDFKLNPTGTTANILGVIVQKHDETKVRELNKALYEKGLKVKSLLEGAKKATSGVLFEKGILGLHQDEVYNNAKHHHDLHSKADRKKR